MDDESGKFTDRAEMTSVGRSESRDQQEVVGEKQGVDPRDEMKHNEKTDQLFVKTKMKVTRESDHR